MGQRGFEFFPLLANLAALLAFCSFAPLSCLFCWPPSFTEDTHLVGIVCPEEHGHKGQPNDNCCVHCEADKFGFVKVFGYLSSFNCVNSAGGDEDHVVD